MYRFVIWWILSSVYISVLSNRVCTPPHKLSLFQHNTVIFNSTSYLTFHDLYAIQCVQTCMKSSPCKTISFNLNNGTCQLYHEPSSQLQLGTDSNFVTTDIQEWPRHLAGACKNHNCPNNTICKDLKTGSYVCETIGCLEPQWARLEADLPFWPLGFEVRVPCKDSNSNGVKICNTNGHWTGFECLPYPKNCTEVKNCNSSYDDGEYWLFYSENKRIKIYCHLMSTKEPKEYVTLIHENFSLRSGYKYVDNTTCNVTKFSESEFKAFRSGKTRFTKVGTVFKNDEIFLSNGEYMYDHYDHVNNLGTASDCLEPREKCPPLGEFLLDLRGTGFMFDVERAVWKPHSTNSGVVGNITISSNAQVINGRCGANYRHLGSTCGGCTKQKRFSLFLNPDDQPDFNSAVLPVCNI